MRLRSLIIIKQAEELCVCVLIFALQLAKHVISRHLAQLKEADLLASCRQGLWIDYHINDELPDWISQVIQITTEAIAKLLLYKDDRLALSTMQNRPITVTVNNY